MPAFFAESQLLVGRTGSVLFGSVAASPTHFDSARRFGAKWAPPRKQLLVP